MSNMSSNIRAQPVGPSAPDEPITFATGQFAGQTIRAELEELQKADLGRKFARKDRRPLDPPPVARLRLFRIFNHGTPSSYEREFDHYEEVVAFSLACHLDVFPVRGEDGSGSLPWENMGNRQEVLSQPTPTLPSAFAAAQLLPPPADTQTQLNFYTIPPPPPIPDRSYQNASFVTYPMSLSEPQANITSICEHPIQGAIPSLVRYPPTFNRPTDLQRVTPLQRPLFSPDVPHGHGQPVLPRSNVRNHSTNSDTVAYFNGQAVTEGSKCTRWLELCMQLEGTFVLRYRAFSLHARAMSENSIPAIAECWGGHFKIYSTKNFPGLRASTELTKHLSALGLRTHVREHERKRRKVPRLSDKYNSANRSLGVAASSAATSHVVIGRATARYEEDAEDDSDDSSDDRD
ncbi:hypothetical protein CERSUDRAFT_94755 [Gelatoporia subvermispora B]|uniref:Velvet domain-containing protein n=1 Tax=Ceriporiopsis subvermispora (strain B) TaxID=914234 RepID=M2RH03_CERS8|nr:hypothetical protein CERSUDRAFT_94755 [Gelatoporia subvermispora B]